MSDNPQIAFVDEYGDHNLNTDLQGVSTHYIVSAVIVDQCQVDAARKCVVKVQNKFYPVSELKSSKVSKNDAKRLDILRDLAELPAHYYSVVIDKRSIDKETGLIYKKPFIKFMHGLLHRRLFQIYPNLLVIADEHGYPEFMNGFKKYVEQRHMPDFFLYAEFRFSPSEEEYLIQAADMVAGTLARIYDTKKLSEAGKDFLRVMESQTIGIDEWPPKFGFGVSINDLTPEETETDKIIREITLTHVHTFIQENLESKEEAVQYQVEALKYLLYVFRFLNPSEYVSTKRLLQEIEQFNNSTISEHYFRSNVIAKLRDQSILIASSSAGYKRPSGSSDLLGTVDHFGNIIGPMLSRLTKARNQVKLGTKGAFDLLGGPKYERLRQIIESTEQ